jgi:hypothetical protein
MFCISCGAQLKDSWQHCINCGKNINKKPDIKQEYEIAKSPEVPLLEETDSIALSISGNNASKKFTFFLVVGIFIIAIVVIFITKNNSDNMYLTSSESQLTNTIDTAQPLPSETADSSDILSRLNSNSSWEWFEDPGQMIGPYAKYQKFIEASYLADFCGVFVLTDEHSADPIFDNWGKKMTYWTITDSLTGKFIRIQTDSGTNVESRPCVIAAGNTFNYTLTNN